MKTSNMRTYGSGLLALFAFLCLGTTAASAQPNWFQDSPAAAQSDNGVYDPVIPTYEDQPNPDASDSEYVEYRKDEKENTYVRYREDNKANDGERYKPTVRILDEDEGTEGE